MKSDLPLGFLDNEIMKSKNKFLKNSKKKADILGGTNGPKTLAVTLLKCNLLPNKFSKLLRVQKEIADELLEIVCEIKNKNENKIKRINKISELPTLAT